VGFEPLPFLGIHFKKKNEKQLLINNVVKNQSRPIKFLQRSFSGKKIKEKLPLLYNQNFFTKSNRLPSNGAKMLGAGITLKQTPQHLNCQLEGFINLETKHKQC